MPTSGSQGPVTEQVSFAEATAVAPAGPDRWSACIPPSWNVPVGIHGGVLMATTLRAARARLDDPSLPMRTAHGSFFARPSTNALTIATDELRRGRTTAHVAADASAEGADEVALSTRSLFTRIRSDESHLDVVQPDVPAPDACPGDGMGDDEGPLARPPLFAQFEVRRAFGTYPWADDWAPGLPMRYARWSRFAVTPALDDGTIDPLALLPLADLPGPAVWTHYGPEEPFRLLVSLELTFHVLEPVTDEWILADFSARWLGQGYTLTQCDLWSGGRLVAHSIQSMLLRTVD